MKVTVHNVIIHRDPMTKISKQVWAWELPVLESQFPGGTVQLVNKTFAEVNELPNGTDEYVRLEQMYGVEEATKQSHVSLAYDRGARGFSLVSAAIADSEYSETVEVSEAPAKVRKSKAAKSNVPVDPLS
jgi:hypothetical protein